MSKEKRLSDCCKSPLKKTNGDELIDFDSNLSKQKVGETYWYVCMKCKNPCDIYSGEPKPIKITCLSLDCPERKSVCCGAGSIATKRKDYMFACTNCGTEFIGGECKMKFILTSQ